MICWKISNVTCVVEVLVVLLASAVVIAASVAEHARLALVHVTHIFLAVIHLLWHLSSEEILVDLLVWINSILLLLSHLLLL